MNSEYIISLILPSTLELEVKAERIRLGKLQLGPTDSLKLLLPPQEFIFSCNKVQLVTFGPKSMPNYLRPPNFLLEKRILAMRLLSQKLPLKIEGTP